MIEARWGSILHYLEDTMEVRPEDVKRFRERYLV